MSTRLSHALAALVTSAVVFTVTSSAAQAAVITFDGAPAPVLLSDAQPLTTQFSAAAGVTFSGTGAVLNSDVDFMVSGFSGPNFLAYLSEAFIGPLGANAISEASDVFTFSTPTNAVSFLAGSGLTGPPRSEGRRLFVNAFNAANALVDSETILLRQQLQLVTLSGMAITRVTLAAELFFGDDEGVGFVVDNINTNANAVPEPASIVLLGSALAGLLATRRRSASRR